MNRPIDPLELLVWIVRIVLVVVLIVLLLGCALNLAQTSTNPVCVVGCTAAPAGSAASGVVIEQTIINEKENAK